MPPSGGDDDGAGEGGGRSMRRGDGRGTAAVAAAGQDPGAEPGSRKRKMAVMSRDTGSLVGSGEHLKVACEDSQRILNEIEDLRAQLDEDVKKLGYCEANQKLRVELALKAKEVKCLRKQNEEMHAKYDGMRKSNEELQDKNEDLAKQNEELQAKNDDLRKQNEMLQTKIKEILENEIDTKRKHLLQFEELFSTVDFPIPQLEEGKRILHKSSVEANPLPSFEEIGRLQAQVTKLETTVFQLMANNCKLTETKAALKEEVTAYAADLEHTRKKNKELQSKKASAEQLVAMFQQVQDVSDIGFDDTELDTRICDLMVTGCKSKSRSKRNKEHRRDTPTNKNLLEYQRSVGLV